ncbi:MAG TPA: hypothetical protein VL088_08715, partial [Pedobacter sp.]|nr:hypothetical protein [Pedobacter sp.]
DYDGSKTDFGSSINYGLQEYLIASVVDCIRTVRNKLGLTIPEAEALVLASKAWDAEKKEFDRFKEHFFQLATKYHWFH